MVGAVAATHLALLIRRSRLAVTGRSKPDDESQLVPYMWYVAFA
ncbi:hypothetical protein O1L68_03200 [Streptomyces lydicus]|nr:hypothetical protein [Streptomyces lydicus]